MACYKKFLFVLLFILLIIFINNTSLSFDVDDVIVDTSMTIKYQITQDYKFSFFMNTPYSNSDFTDFIIYLQPFPETTQSRYYITFFNKEDMTNLGETFGYKGSTDNYYYQDRHIITNYFTINSDGTLSNRTFSGYSNYLYYYITANDSIQFLYSTCDLPLNQQATQVFAKNVYLEGEEPPVITKNPEIVNTVEQLQDLSFDFISIDGWDYSTETIFLNFYDLSYSNIITKSRFTLNQSSEYFMSEISADPDVNSIYWIDKSLIFDNWQSNHNYKFTITDFNNNILDEVSFTTSSIQQSTIDEINNNSQYEQTKQSINNIDNYLNDTNYNDEQVNDTFNNLSSGSNNIDNSEYIGLFSAVFNRFSNIINSDFSTVESIELPVPFTSSSIYIYSNIVTKYIQNTFIYTLLQAFWLFIFGMYIFKFSNNLIIKIKDGSILNGYSNSNEVITNTML